MICQDCGMNIKRAGEFHPYAYCLMFKACKDGEVVRTNAKYLAENYPNQDKEK